MPHEAASSQVSPMYNLLISLGVSGVVFALVAALYSPFAGIFPALFVFPVVAFVLVRRTMSAVQAALEPAGELAQQRKLDEVRALFAETKERYQWWQPMLARQLDGQLGMLDYAQGRFDDALPLLEGSFRDWSTTLAAGCVHIRRERIEEAKQAFDDAAAYAPKEPAVWLIPATLLSRADQRSEAVVHLTKGLEQLPDNEQLKRAKKRIANKQKVDVEGFQMMWFQFFPEEAMKLAMMRGARPGSRPDLPFQQMMQQGPPQPKSRGKLARRR